MNSSCERYGAQQTVEQWCSAPQRVLDNDTEEGET